MKVFALLTRQGISARLFHLCLLILSTSLLLMSSGCLPQEDKGSLTINFSANNARSILPEIDMDISSYNIRGSGPGGASFSRSTMEGSVTIEDLVLGTWTIEVDGLNAEGTIVGFGSESATLVNSIGTQCYITVRPLMGDGALALTVTWGDYTGPVLITSGLIRRTTGATAIPVDFVIGTNSATYTNNAIPAGYYDLTLVINNGSRDIGGAMETVRIVNGETTSATINIVINEGGDATIVIGEEMNDPVNVVLTGQQNMLLAGSSMTVSAVGENITAAENPVYRWYLNGSLINNSATATFGSDLLIGTYRLDVSIFSSNGERGGSVTHMFTVVETAAQIIADHTCIDLSKVPEESINTAKDVLHIAYQHTSHGSQIISGMNTLAAYPAYGNLYQRSEDGSVGLDLDSYDPIMSGYHDLSTEDSEDSNGDTPWANATRTFLDNTDNHHINVVMWSWCSINGHNISRYITNMERLISEYSVGGTNPRAAGHPVEFVFMTGHTAGQGEDAFIAEAAAQIRSHCVANNRWLIDYYDLECYDPDVNYFGDLYITDNLDYNSGANNWAVEYLERHDGEILDILTMGDGDSFNGCTSCAHSDSPRAATLNCVIKGQAAWWLFARLAGWDGVSEN